MPGEKRWITVTEAAKQSGCSVRTLQRWLKRGWIEGWKPGHDWLTTLEAVEAYKATIKRGRPPKSN